MHRVHLEALVDGPDRRDQRLGRDLAAEDALPVGVGAVAPEEVGVEGLDVEELDELRGGRRHPESLSLVVLGTVEAGQELLELPADLLPRRDRLVRRRAGCCPPARRARTRRTAARAPGRPPAPRCWRRGTSRSPRRARGRPRAGRSGRRRCRRRALDVLEQRHRRLRGSRAGRGSAGCAPRSPSRRAPLSPSRSSSRAWALDGMRSSPRQGLSPDEQVGVVGVVGDRDRPGVRHRHRHRAHPDHPADAEALDDVPDGAGEGLPAVVGLGTVQQQVRRAAASASRRTTSRGASYCS